MTREAVLKDLREKLGGDILSLVEKSPKRIYVDIKPDAIRKWVLYLHKDLGARFNIASGVDMREHMEILYHFTLEEINVVISLRVRLEKSHLSIDSVTPQLEAANWIEREIHELLGIEFKGHPDMRRLLLPDNWPKDVYPLRQDYKEWDPEAIRDRGV
jgi:Ni,Fe-hydrogenase III component G